MNKINILGLGPGDIDSLTLGAVKKLHDKNLNVLRTDKHPTIEYLKENNIDYISCDRFYENENTFENVYEEIEKYLIKLARERKEINYFTPGNPLVAEKVVSKLINKDIEDIEVNLFTGLSFIEPMLEAVRRDPIDGFTILDAIDLSIYDFDIHMDTIITQTYNKRIMSEVKLALSEVYGDEYRVYLINNAGISGLEDVKYTYVYELDRFDEIGNLTSLFIPRINDESVRDISDLLKTMDKLRSRDGCPWDKEQDYFSIKDNIVEEAYELVNAVENKELDNLIEELGDVLFQVVFYSQLGLEDGYFNIYDVYKRINNKLIYRHPHVFSEKTVEKKEEIVYNWDKLKYSERNLVTNVEKMKDIPKTSTLMRSYKVQKIMSKVGFDWPDINGALEKIIEEYNEVLELIDTKERDKLRVEEEVGDLLFSVVNLSRFLKVNPDLALNKAVEKFISRISFIEDEVLKKDKVIEDFSLEELEEMWQKAKK